MANRPGPSPEEVEISLFGPGYGECALVHLGLNEWMVVDCCEDEDDGIPVLQYLESMDVNPAEAVKLIVASHWHDDHVRGIAKLLQRCEQARFSCSSAIRAGEAMAAVRLREAHGPERRSRPLRELSQVFDIIRERMGKSVSSTFEWGEARTLPLFEREISLAATVRALSPSAMDRVEAAELIGSLLRVGTDTSSRLRPHPNHASVVLWVTVGDVTMLLGSDLENRTEPQMGWTAILNGLNGRPPGTADIYKVAHHGSITAHDPRIWAELLVESPLALVTPWQYPIESTNYLPQPEDITRLCGLAGQLWITAMPTLTEIAVYDDLGGPPIVPDKVIETPHATGRVTFRRNSEVVGSRWVPDYSDPAYQACGGGGATAY